MTEHTIALAARFPGGTGFLRLLRACGTVAGLTVLLCACSGAAPHREGTAGLTADLTAPSSGGSAAVAAMPVSAPVAAVVKPSPVVSAAISTPVVAPAPAPVAAAHQDVAALTTRGGAGRVAQLTQIRCDAALTEASDAVYRYRKLSVQEISARSWAEEALRASDLAQRACDMAPDQAMTALSLRATALYLHGQYSRAALYLEQVPEQTLPEALPRSGGLSTAAVVRQCQTHRPDLDDLRLGILLKQAGHGVQGAEHLKRAARSACAPLAKLADALRRT